MPSTERSDAVLSLATAGLAVLVLVLVGADARFDDNVASTAPLIKTTVRLWSHGLPAWNPYDHMGEPYLPQLLGEPYYPPALLLGALLPLEAIPTTWVVLHAALAAAGAVFLARTLGRSPGASVLAGVAFGLGAPLLSIARCWMMIGLVGAWTPWLVAFALRARRGSLRDVALAGLALGLEVHAGGAEPATWGSLLALALCLADAPGGARLEGSNRVLLALGLGTLLASPLVLETIAALSYSNRAETLRGGVELSPEMLLGVVLPPLPARTGVPWATTLARSTFLYQGFVPHLVLAAAFRWKKASPTERVLAAAGALALFACLGSHSGADRALALVPLLRIFHHPIGKLHVVGLAIALLAASALDRLDEESPRRVVVAAASLIAAPVAVALSMLFVGGAREALEAERGPLLVLGAGALVASAGIAFLRGRSRRTAVVVATAALLGLQLALAWTSVSSYRPEVSGPLAPVASEARASQGRVAVVLAEQELLHLPMPEMLGRDEGGVFGFPSTAGYSVVYRPGLISHWGILPMGEAVLGRWGPLLDGSALEAAGIEFVHGSRALVDLVRKGHGRDRLRERSHTERSVTFTNALYAGRAYRVLRAEGSALGPSDLGRADLLDVALVASRSPLAGRSFARGRVSGFHETPGAIDVELEPLDSPSLLVVTESWAPGWRAEVSGRSASCEEAQCGLLAIEVPPDGHSLALRYESVPLRVGLVLAALALAAIAVTLGAARSKR